MLVRGRKQTSQKRVNRKRVSRSTVDRGSKDSEFKIACWLEAQLLAVNKWLIVENLAGLPREANRRRTENKLSAAQLSQEQLDSHGSEPTQHAGQFERTHPV